MVIQLKQDITEPQRAAISQELERAGYSFREVITSIACYWVAIGNNDMDIRSIGNLPGITDIHRVTDSYKLVSGMWKLTPSSIPLGNGISIGGGNFTIMAGPCSIENDAQVSEVAGFLKSNGVFVMRGGVFKPRSSPYSFRGVGIEGLRYFHSICKLNGVLVVSEVMEPDQIEAMYPYIDIFQVGTRNAQNFSLLDALGRVDKPVMIKRGFSGTIEELLYSAEYVFSGGNEKIILCERGIRTFEKAYRNTLDLNAVPILKQKSHLPVVVDPSHGTGIRNLVEPMSLAAVMAGADGVIVEIHREPEKAYSDGIQSLCYSEAEQLFDRLRQTVSLKSTFGLS
ncbi:3-deoxy-7-phosphoheptulonate synthase [Williamwhitmania taraxaci]|uniref:3-deoxy-D-arabinoheptulosonate-7-phosphate synthase n=1 Tax=Williamwhitmania taraxaci TaxID=1640674 RepID=A0A1G6LP45_9BACT|nr:3-deoxy-7-phosphoheptulonate synthase [Williamwhitmania taraxaci]SDC44847.1 3-deoxy-D-arabinoheptulosonate-7-phosphate synthase [Williamwhitmania taraxaci]